MNDTQLQHQILNRVARKDYEPLATKALARKMNTAREDYRDFAKAVRALLRQGRLELGRNRKIRLPHPHGTAVGIFRRTQQGHGFVRVKPGPAPPTPRPSGLPPRDIFIHRANVGDAANGDEVLVRLTKAPAAPGRRPEGRIVEIVQRASQQFVGVYFVEAGDSFVRVDGNVFADPVYTGDAGAKGAKPGDKVVFEMVRFPSAAFEGEGVVTEVLGPRGRPGVDTLSVIRAFNLPDTFDDDALQEARDAANRFDETDLAGRRDLTRQTIVTIDPVDARDFDDAISLDRDRKGHWHLGVHIADVSHFVRPNSALYRTARKRGTSVYLPDRVIPMLPELISNSLASLQQRKVRYTKSVFIEFDPGGVPLGYEVARSAIKVTKRLHYELASQVLENPSKFHGRISVKVRALLQQMRDLALILRRRRFEHGALELNMPEVEIDLDDQGKVSGAHYVNYDISHQMIEEFMLAANQAVARELAERGIPFLRRVHDDPDPRKLEAFGEFARHLGFKIKQPQSRFELQKVLHQAVERPEVYAVNYALLRSLKRAVYSPEELGHYALAADCYTHFTSPIRRLTDLTVHALLDAVFDGKRPRANAAELIALGEHCTLTERRAEDAERELIKVKLLEYLNDRVGMPLDAIITGVEEYGFFAQAKDFPAEGLVHASTLSDDYYYYDESAHSLIGRRQGRRYRLGDEVRVRVVRVDLERRQLDFRLTRGRG